MAKRKYPNKYAPDGDYSVGFCKPPVHSQWKKGQSGNPRGPKPRKSLPYHPSQFVEGAELAKIIFTEEAYRPISVNQSGTSIELPTLQAVLRVMGMDAVKSDRFARRDFLAYAMDVERERNEIRHRFNETLFRYKFEGATAIAEARRKGLPSLSCFPILTISSRIDTLAACISAVLRPKKKSGNGMNSSITELVNKTRSLPLPRSITIPPTPNIKKCYSKIGIWHRDCSTSPTTIYRRIIASTSSIDRERGERRGRVTNATSGGRSANMIRSATGQ